MMNHYTVRYAHLEEESPLEMDQLVIRGMEIGVMGNSGQSTNPHLHIDVVEGKQYGMYRLSNLEKGIPKPDFRQLQFFIDEELSGGKRYTITTYPYDPRYLFGPGGTWKAHPAIDLVVDGSDPVLYWNRSHKGKVVNKGYDSGYGHFVSISYFA